MLRPRVNWQTTLRGYVITAKRKAEQKHWSELWLKARNNMPHLKKGRGDATALMMCLGYSYKPNKNNNAGILWRSGPKAGGVA